MRNELSTQLLFELSRPGARACRFPENDVTDTIAPLENLIPSEHLAESPPSLPELTEPEIIRHYTNLSTLNFSVDTHFYPLGSCTMKYNPKRNERLANLDGISQIHPYQDEYLHTHTASKKTAQRSSIEGTLEILWQLQEMLAEIAGLDAVSLQPAAGAHGELTALLVAAAYFRDQGQQRTTVLIPDSAHGTNPASAALAGFDTVQVNSTSDGLVDLEDLSVKLNNKVGLFMITNPNTLGLFDDQIQTIAEMIHKAGALLYLDGANMNAILGVSRPGDFGADLMHYNPHKTFSGPHGAGGPGAGPIAVRDMLAPYLPAPVIRRSSNHFHLDYDLPKSVGQVRCFFGNTGVLIRAYCYIRTYGPEGLRHVAENAVLNANYLRSLVQKFLPVPHGTSCMHEFVASARPLHRERGIRAMDLAKRLLDFGFHAPTVYFPLVVPEALMIEPTETESKSTMEAFAQTLEKITNESADLVSCAPHTTPICRPDEVIAARNPVLRWHPGNALD